MADSLMVIYPDQVTDDAAFSGLPVWASTLLNRIKFAAKSGHKIVVESVDFDGVKSSAFPPERLDKMLELVADDVEKDLFGAF